jgi:hypothetical protein
VSGRIFISYRREETAYPAGWLFDRLASRYGDGQVFKDVDSIQLGDDFVEVITRAVGSCDVLLVLIGNEWLTITDAYGRRRLDNPDDFVRLEIEAALTRNVRVIPILVDGARMPRADELPDNLARLVRRQALDLSPARFDFDTGRLLKVVDRTLAEVRTAQEDAATTIAPAAEAPDPSMIEPPPSGRAEPSRVPRRHLSRRAWVLTGAGAAILLLLVIVVIVARPDGSRTGVAAITSPPTDKLIFRDDFSSRAFSWVAYDKPEFGRYADGVYRISFPLPDSGSGSVPTLPSRVYPSAPPDLRIEVDGRRLPSSDPNMHYGITCRTSDGGDSYVFTVSDHSARILRYGSRYKRLIEEKINIDGSSTNRLQAVCSSVKEQQAVHLELWVNGHKVAETTDRDSPLSTGYVGLVIETDQTTRPRVAEFDNFVVTQI